MQAERRARRDAKYAGDRTNRRARLAAETEEEKLVRLAHEREHSCAYRKARRLLSNKL